MKLVASILTAALTLSGCASYNITSRAQGGSVMANGAGYDYGSTRWGSGTNLTYEEISKACQSRSLQNGLVGALFLAPVPVGGTLTAAQTVALGGLSVLGVTYAIGSAGYTECMELNYGIALAPTANGGFGFRVDDEQAKIWSSLTEEQRIRAAKFVEAGGTVQSALQPDR